MLKRLLHKLRIFWWSWTLCPDAKYAIRTPEGFFIFYCSTTGQAKLGTLQHAKWYDGVRSFQTQMHEIQFYVGHTLQAV